MSMQETALIVSMCVGFVSLVGGLIYQVRSAAIKEYSNQRSLEHLKKHYESISNLLLRLSDELEVLNRSMIVIQSRLEDKRKEP